MHWIEKYTIVFLDFDGLLVSTEPLHFLAYQRMCQKRGFVLPWNFTEYCQFAHSGSLSLSLGVYEILPDLYLQEPCWSILYEEKKAAYQEILKEKPVDLLPGVEAFLRFLQEKKIRRCVVTNSFSYQVEAIRALVPVLNTIPFWVTREDSSEPKPSPAPYLVALKKHAEPEDKSIGFEDTPKGFQALQGAGIEPVLVSSLLSTQERKSICGRQGKEFSSFEDLLAMRI